MRTNFTVSSRFVVDDIGEVINNPPEEEEEDNDEEGEYTHLQEPENFKH